MDYHLPEVPPIKHLAGPGEVIWGIVFAIYHWPLFLAALLVRGKRRVPFWAILISFIATPCFYAGMLLLFATKNNRYAWTR